MWPMTGWRWAEMVRVTKMNGRILIFLPQPLVVPGGAASAFYWRGRYKFGNIPLVNYLPNAQRNWLKPYVRTYTRRNLLDLCRGLPVKVVHHGSIFWRVRQY